MRGYRERERKENEVPERGVKRSRLQVRLAILFKTVFE
jgi:hypothetical protein